MGSTKRILVVDDEEINLEFFQVMLGNLGYEAYTARDGEEGLAMIRKHKPHLVLLDNMMPRMTGWELTRTIKTDPAYAAFAETPVIMFSAMDEARDKVEGFELGVEDYITKPFNFGEVLARIKAVLRTHDLINQIERRERRLAVVERIGDRIGAWTEELRKPLERALLKLDGGSQAAQDEIGHVLSRLDAMRTEVASLREEAEELKRSEIVLESIRDQVRESGTRQGGRR